MTALEAFLFGMPALLIVGAGVTLWFAKRAAAEIDRHSGVTPAPSGGIRNPEVARILRQHREHGAGLS